MTIRIDINNLIWNVCRDDRSGKWTASCEPLKLVAEADSFSDLTMDMNGAIQDLLTYLLKEGQGQLEAFLRGAGWHPARAFLIPQGVPPEDLRFEVPFDMIRRQMDGSNTVHA